MTVTFADIAFLTGLLPTLSIVYIFPVFENFHARNRVAAKIESRDKNIDIILKKSGTKMR